MSFILKKLFKQKQISWIMLPLVYLHWTHLPLSFLQFLSISNFLKYEINSIFKGLVLNFPSLYLYTQFARLIYLLVLCMILSRSRPNINMLFFFVVLSMFQLFKPFSLFMRVQLPKLYFWSSFLMIQILDLLSFATHCIYCMHAIKLNCNIARGEYQFGRNVKFNGTMKKRFQRLIMINGRAYKDRPSRNEVHQKNNQVGV